MVSSPRWDGRGAGRELFPTRWRLPLLLQVDRDLLDFAGELERHVVTEVHRRAVVLAHVEALVEGDADRHRLFDPALRHILAVNEEGRCAALARPAAVISEVHLDRVLTRGES